MQLLSSMKDLCISLHKGIAWFQFFLINKMIQSMML